MVVYSNQPPVTELDEFYVHTLTVETFEGSGAAGDVYSNPQYVPGFFEGKVTLVRDAAGQEVVSSSRFFTDTDYADIFTPDTRVTIDGRVSYVVSQARHDSGALHLPDHAEIYLK
ncbi:MAG: hypothetical protein M3O29_08160 [Actinomycetota bacterium]|nr:hypothetical protein [Actinomycetota bacterium]